MKLIELYDLYQELLTEKQKVYFESYYFEDYSISEISENENVSRNAVHDQLKKTTAKLNDIEDAVHLRKTNMKLNSLFETLKKIESKEKIIKLKHFISD